MIVSPVFKNSAEINLIFALFFLDSLLLCLIAVSVFSIEEYSSKNYDIPGNPEDCYARHHESGSVWYAAD
jgi:hypothetical protein